MLPYATRSTRRDALLSSADRAQPVLCVLPQVIGSAVGSSILPGLEVALVPQLAEHAREVQALHLLPVRGHTVVLLLWNGPSDRSNGVTSERHPRTHDRSTVDGHGPDDVASDNPQVQAAGGRRLRIGAIHKALSSPTNQHTNDWVPHIWRNQGSCPPHQQPVEADVLDRYGCSTIVAKGLGAAHRDCLRSLGASPYIIGATHRDRVPPHQQVLEADVLDRYARLPQRLAEVHRHLLQQRLAHLDTTTTETTSALSLAHLEIGMDGLSRSAGGRLAGDLAGCSPSWPVGRRSPGRPCCRSGWSGSSGPPRATPGTDGNNTGDLRPEHLNTTLLKSQINLDDACHGKDSRGGGGGTLSALMMWRSARCIRPRW
jgi:hypothetical protein